ncbi:alpha-defensin 1-like [Equus quagga]|uniref:alpha-defensin 1-like n=1 Tax=Equus quagga TaxID=89248 RepID=UPI00071A7B8D|nr:alpha-defensin 1-like [Equus asinus]XP_046506271.1 alpha-defensin 1-like [Equus quagga]XP_046506272.1 alpha-defensin 1-like [Equus quagga]XP_046507799.1 alpha-defensin 1-like [Equus quagga]XP_046507801.1 alpha-defensin 1-like [Equus quagga]
MRTLTLLAALLLLALQVQTQSLEETADQVPAQDQPGAEAQDMTISFAGDERSAREASKRLIVCTCRRPWSCRLGERHSGTCRDRQGLIYRLCCRR